MKGIFIRPKFKELAPVNTFLLGAGGVEYEEQK